MTVSIFPCNVNQVIRFIPVDHILNNEPHGITERYWVPDLKSGEPAVVRLLNPAKRRTEPQIVCERLKHVGTPIRATRATLLAVIRDHHRRSMRAEKARRS